MVRNIYKESYTITPVEKKLKKLLYKLKNLLQQGDWCEHLHMKFEIR